MYKRQPFNDVDGHWAEDQINEAVDAGYISGVSDSVFSPNTAITRAQFIRMINNALSLIHIC